MDGSASISSRACGLGERRREHAAAHRALVADVADERARVEVGDRRDPGSVSQLSHPCSAPGASSRSTPARMIAARAWMRSDSIASAETP